MKLVLFLESKTLKLKFTGMFAYQCYVALVCLIALIFFSTTGFEQLVYTFITNILLYAFFFLY